MSSALHRKCDAWTACMLAADDFIEIADRTAENAAVAIEPEIALESSEVAHLEKVAKKEERKEIQAAQKGTAEHVGIGNEPEIAPVNEQTVSGMPLSFIRHPSAPLSRGQKLIKFLGTMLRAGGAGTQSGSLVGSAIHAEKKKMQPSDAAGCMDPSEGDMETWECECMDQMIDSCGGIDESCFANRMCHNPMVCASWKMTDDHCQTKQNVSIKAPQQQGSALMSRGAQRAISIVDDRLDSALSGKCSQ